MSPTRPPTQDADAAAAAPADTTRVARLGLWALGAGFGGFLLWAVLAPLDAGVPTAGTVAIDTKRKAVQHLSGGIVQQVLVREGDTVREGQALVRLDDGAARASHEAVRQRYLGLRAMQGRLLAEQAGQDRVTHHPDLREAASDPLIAQQMRTQDQLLVARRGALRADLQAIEEVIQGQEGLLQSYERMLTSRREQLASLQDELKSTRSLVAEGYAPRNRQRELERQEAEARAQIAELDGSIARARRAVTEQRQRALARQQEYRKEVEAQLAEVTREVLADAEKFASSRADLARTEIKAPAAGQVVGLVAQTVGGVVQPGQKLMDIVPVGETLLLESRIEPHLIDRVRAGQPTDVRFSAFAHSPQLVVQGEVVSVSSDLLSDPQTGATYYLARVKLTPEGMKALGSRQLQPGMPVEVIVKTGERSLLVYLLDPLTRRLSAAMKEE